MSENSVEGWAAVKPGKLSIRRSHSDASGRVLDGEAVCRWQAERRSSRQKQVRCRLAVLDLPVHTAA